MKSTLLVLLNLVFLSGSLCAQETNLAKGLTYSCDPQPSYPHCTDEADAKQLTDGVTEYQTGNIWMRKSSVGWYAEATSPVVILFDLGAEASLRELRFNTTGGGTADVQDVGLRVYVSLDDRSYVCAGEFPTSVAVPPDKATVRGIQRRVLLNDARARYVAICAAPPPKYTYVFVDEIEIIGRTPADPTSGLPVQASTKASGAAELRQVLSGGQLATKLMQYVSAPVLQHITNWPAEAALAQREDLDALIQQGVIRAEDYHKLLATFVERHRQRARQVYDSDTLIWEVPPDETFTILSLPQTLKPTTAQGITIDTAVNALEATAIGVANLAQGDDASLEVSVSGPGNGAPVVTPRVARFFATENGMSIPDALLARDCPQVVPPGESKLVWFSAESTDATPGTYEYQAEITIGDKTTLIPLAVHVHDVTLSKETPLSTGNWSYLDTGQAPLYREVRDVMLSNRITNAFGTSQVCPYPKQDKNGEVIRPVQLDFTAMDKFLEFHKDFPQVSWFLNFDAHSDRPVRSNYGKAEWMSPEFKEIFEEWLTKIVDHVKTKGRDYDSFYIQFFDEMLNEKVSDCSRLVHSIDPKVQGMITFYTDASAAAVESFVKQSAMDTGVYVHHTSRLGYDNAPDGYPLLADDGRELWFYGAADIATGNGGERDALTFFRLMHWLAFRHGATGVYFWNMLQNETSGWKDGTVGERYWPFVYTNGEGYPPVPDDVKTAEKVIPSRRWEYARMGIEDYMLLKMAQQRITGLGSAGAGYQAQLDSIVRTVLLNGSQDRKLFRQKHKELLELLEKLPQLRG